MNPKNRTGASVLRPYPVATYGSLNNLLLAFFPPKNSPFRVGPVREKERRIVMPFKVQIEFEVGNPTDEAQTKLKLPKSNPKNKANPLWAAASKMVAQKLRDESFKKVTVTKTERK